MMIGSALAQQRLLDAFKRLSEAVTEAMEMLAEAVRLAVDALRQVAEFIEWLYSSPRFFIGTPAPRPFFLPPRI